MRGWFSVSVFVALVGGLPACGPANGTGFLVSGQVALTDTAGTTRTGYTFAQQIRIDPTLPADASVGFTGICQTGPNGRSVRIQSVGGDALGLNTLAITMPDWSTDTCANCAHGSVAATLGTTAFTGSEQRGSASSQCTFTAVRRGTFGMQLDMSCAGLTAAGDPRSLSLQGSLTLDGCDGPGSMVR